MVRVKGKEKGLGILKQCLFKKYLFMTSSSQLKEVNRR